MVSPDSATSDLPPEGDQEGGEEAKPKLKLDVQVDKPGACQRHITVTIAREDIDRYLSEAVDTLLPRAEVRGFRAGRAPRKLVESFYREQVRDQVKGSLLLDSLQQISEEHDFSAISEPDFKYQAVELPEEGPLTFEFDLEVRPEFDVPDWKGLDIQRPVHEVTEDDVNHSLAELLSRFGKLVPVDEPARLDDYVVVNLKCVLDGEELSRGSEYVVRVRPKLNFSDGELTGFDELMVGAKAGDTRSGKATLGQGARKTNGDPLDGKEVTVDFEVLEVKRMELPELTPAFLGQIGSFTSEEELRDLARRELERKVNYEQQQQMRQQVIGKLTASANWELPPDLLKRQARREMERAVMELQSNGYSPEDIRAHENYLRRNILVNTAQALREHFLLEKIAEDHDIEPTENDYDAQIKLIAMYRNESPRRVRARLEKKGQMDTLRNQIIESRVLEMIAEEANFTDVPYQLPRPQTAPVDHSLGGGVEMSEIPEAQGGEAEELREPVDHT